VHKYSLGTLGSPLLFWEGRVAADHNALGMCRSANPRGWAIKRPARLVRTCENPHQRPVRSQAALPLKGSRIHGLDQAVPLSESARFALHESHGSCLKHMGRTAAAGVGKMLEKGNDRRLSHMVAVGCGDHIDISCVSRPPFRRQGMRPLLEPTVPYETSLHPPLVAVLAIRGCVSGCGLDSLNPYRWHRSFRIVIKKHEWASSAISSNEYAIIIIRDKG